MDSIHLVLIKSALSFKLKGIAKFFFTITVLIVENILFSTIKKRSVLL